MLFVLLESHESLGVSAYCKRKTLPMSGGLAGIATGFTSFMSHAGGPPAAIYLLYAKSSKIEYPASTVIVIWLTDITKALPYSFFGN